MYDNLVEPIIKTESQLGVEYNRKVETNDFEIYKYVTEIKLTENCLDIFQHEKRKSSSLMFFEGIQNVLARNICSKINLPNENINIMSTESVDRYLSTFCYILRVEEIEFASSPYMIPIYVLDVYARMKKEEYIAKKLKQQLVEINQYMKDKEKESIEDKIIEDSEYRLYQKLKNKYEKGSRFDQAVMS